MVKGIQFTYIDIHVCMYYVIVLHCILYCIYTEFDNIVYTSIRTSPIYPDSR